MRLDRFLSNLKYGSRKDVTKWIKKGYCLVNGEIVKDPAAKIEPMEDKVIFDDNEVYFNDSVLLKLHKPKGYVSANHDKVHQTVFDLISEPYSRFDLHIAGRLDIDTEGLVLLTNKGSLLHNIISPNKNIYKKYLVEVEKTFDFDMLLDPMEILDGKDYPFTPQPPKVEKIDEKSFYLSIKEGKFHQVKRMVEYCGSEVTYLKRVSIGDIELGDLEPRRYEEATEKEKRLFE